MKYVIVLFIVSQSLMSCQMDKPLEAIVNLNSKTLVIEAGLLDSGKTYPIQITQVTTEPMTAIVDNSTTPPSTKYSAKKNYISTATVSVIAADKTEYKFTYNSNYQLYTASAFPLTSSSYTLRVVYNGETYESTTQPIEKPNVENSVTYPNDILTITSTISNKVGVDNTYSGDFYKLRKYDPLNTSALSNKSSFTSGSQYSNPTAATPIVHSDKAIEKYQISYVAPFSTVLSGDTVLIVINRISTLQTKIISTYSPAFSTPNLLAPPPPFVRSNIVNKTNADNKCIGYFCINSSMSSRYVKP